ncbi:unnamed protein product [Durusdinium trenchii]|uniref:Ubiquitin-like domain-containing protein n=1 Tax=Durusdinium trenchii TaxID=1381693 RepID=A0ABP0N1Y6_9DINO
MFAPDLHISTPEVLLCPALDAKKGSDPLVLRRPASPATESTRKPFPPMSRLTWRSPGTASICGGFGREPNRELHPDKWSAWYSSKFDSVSKKEFTVCECEQKKIFSHKDPHCELNKFDDMMNYLQQKDRRFGQLVVVDEAFEVLNRAWCIAEIMEGNSLHEESKSCSQFQMRVNVFSRNSVDLHYDNLAVLDVTKCDATSEEDKQFILSKVSGREEAFNLKLQDLIFGCQGLFNPWIDVKERTRRVGLIWRRCAASTLTGEAAREAFSQRRPTLRTMWSNLRDEATDGIKESALDKAICRYAIFHMGEGRRAPTKTSKNYGKWTSRRRKMDIAEDIGSSKGFSGKDRAVPKTEASHQIHAPEAPRMANKRTRSPEEVPKLQLSVVGLDGSDFELRVDREALGLELLELVQQRVGRRSGQLKLYCGAQELLLSEPLHRHLADGAVVSYVFHKVNLWGAWQSLMKEREPRREAAQLFQMIHHIQPQMPPGQAPDEAEGPREMCLKSADVPLPRSLEILQLNIHRWNFYQPDMALQLDLAHTRIHTLVFGDDFDTKLDEIVLPCTLRKLQFGAHFNRSLKNVQIPSSLEELIFGHNFNQSMKGVNLGENLKTLVFGRMFNMSMRSWKIPHSVRHLTLGETYNHILKGVKFPELESFTFCGTFKEKVAEAEHRR